MRTQRGGGDRWKLVLIPSPLSTNLTCFYFTQFFAREADFGLLVFDSPSVASFLLFDWLLLVYVTTRSGDMALGVTLFVWVSREKGRIPATLEPLFKFPRTVIKKTTTQWACNSSRYNLGSSHSLISLELKGLWILNLNPPSPSRG